MFIVKYRKIFFAVSLGALILAFYAMGVKGFNVGIDFKGGSIVEVSYDVRPDIEVLNKALSESGFEEGSRIQLAGDNDVMIKTLALSESNREALVSALAIEGTQMEEKRSNSIGPTIGKELRTKAWYAIALVILAIVLFIAYAFRHVSEPISSWKYGMITTVTLLHDITLSAGLFVWLGKEVDALFVVALLSIMGVSVHDTIVVFDRIRENLRLRVSNDFATTVGTSLRQTFTRSINTSLTVMLVLATLYFFGPTSTKDFSLLLWVGIFVGTYSSVFIASPLLVFVEKLQNKG